MRAFHGARELPPTSTDVSLVSWTSAESSASEAETSVRWPRQGVAVAGALLICAGAACVVCGLIVAASSRATPVESATRLRAAALEAPSEPLLESTASLQSTPQADFPLFRRSFSCPGGRATPPPHLWKPPAPKDKLGVKVLSYNLYWWNLFGKHEGRDNSAGKLIVGSSSPPYDVMGFQECEDPNLVLGPVDLLKQYHAFQGAHAMCMAYRKNTWTLLARGEADVAEDQASEHYGARGAQWMRLRHSRTSQTLFFVNHHGPLSVNSGGKCGGVTTAHNLVRLIASKGREGDIVVLVGDFNANAASLTIQELWKYIVLAYNGDSFGGVDNIFSNVGVTSVTTPRTVGSGGSDHNAISVVLEAGGPAPEPVSGWRLWRTAGQREPSKALRDAKGSQCGRIEENLEYVYDGRAKDAEDASDPRGCCAACQKSWSSCKAWVFSAPGKGAKPRCSLKFGSLIRVDWKANIVSGLPIGEAHRLAVQASSRAASFMR